MEGRYAIIAFIGGFVVAQLWKFIAGLFTKAGKQKRDFKTMVGYLTRSGGMPSGHSASMTAITTFLGLSYGFDSGMFALSMAVTAIIIYDAIHVRYAVGLQGEALNKMLKREKEGILPITEGHTPAQALVGILLGIGIGMLVFSASQMVK